MVSRESQQYNEALARHFQRMGAVAALSLEDQRVVAEGLQALTGTPEGVCWRDASEDAVSGVWSEPDPSFLRFPDAAILYFHGGGFCVGSPVGYRNLVGHIARAAGVRALAPRYGLAPERAFPHGLNDAVAAYRSLRESGVAAQRIVVAGDSAGGGLALGMLLRLRDEGEELPRATALMSPWTDLGATGDSMSTNASVDMMSSADVMRGLGALYAGAEVTNPYASPVEGDFTGLGPIYIQVGGHETLLDDSTRVRDKAQAAGVSAQVEVFPEMQHVFQIGAGGVPEADEAVAKIGTFIASVLTD